MTSSRDTAGQKYFTALHWYKGLAMNARGNKNFVWRTDFGDLTVLGHSLGDARRELKRQRRVFFAYCSFWEQCCYRVQEITAKGNLIRFNHETRRPAL